MKKLVFGLIATVMISALSFGQSEVKFSDYGFYHNEGLRLYNKQFDINNEKDLNSALDNMAKVLEENYPEKFSNLDVAKLKTLYEGYTTKNVNVNKIWNDRKEVMYEEKTLPHEIGNLMDSLLSGNVSYEDALVSINDLKKNENLTAKNINTLVIMESILKSSYSYWTLNSYRSPHGAAFADLCGAIIFSETTIFAAFASYTMSELYSSGNP
jgi:hypothetical protein